MAGTKIGLRDWLLGWIIADPTVNGKGTVGIQGVALVDSAGTEYNSANPIPISASNISVVDATNSSTTPLTGAAAFTGTAKNITAYGSVTVSVFADQASGTNGFSIQQGPDGTNWNFVDSFTVTASSSKTVTIPRQGAFLRVVYTNGATPQTAFRLQTILNAAMPAPSAVKPADGTTFENDFQETLGVNLVSNGTTGDIQRAVTNGTNSVGTGITAAGLVAQLDDTSPTAVSENQFGNLRMSTDRMLLTKVAPYPNLATPLIAGSGNVANASAVATLTGTATTTVYISGFEVTGSGATAGLPVTVTVAGLLGGTRSYTYVFAVGALVGNAPLVVPFDPPLPASAVNTAIVVTCPASGTGGTNNTVVAHGFYQ